ILEINDIYFKQRNSAYITIKEKAKQLEDLNLKYFNLKGSETMAIMARDELQKEVQSMKGDKALYHRDVDNLMNIRDELQNKLEGMSEDLGDADVEVEKLRKENEYLKRELCRTSTAYCSIFNTGARLLREAKAEIKKLKGNKND
ncbi:hypothetical protein KA005_81090, partial [bacterium]|nr:hypothetical protein [bacterium]